MIGVTALVYTVAHMGFYFGLRSWNFAVIADVPAPEPDVVDNARFFALINLSMADAAITCWDGKYDYNFWRPVTAIPAGQSCRCELATRRVAVAEPSGADSRRKTSPATREQT